MKWIYKLPNSSPAWLLLASTVFRPLGKGEARSSSMDMDPLTHFPALAPPAGVTPNFVNPQSQALMVVVTSILSLVLIIFISLLRFYTNLWIKKSIKPDDSKYS